MDPRHRQLLRSKDYIQLRQQVKAYPPFFSVITIFHACEHYHYYYLQVFVQFLYVKKKRWIFIENAYSFVFLFNLGRNDGSQVSTSARAKGPSATATTGKSLSTPFLVITIFHAKIYSFIYVIFPCKINSYHTVTVNLRIWIGNH